jgi:hypothetical protein
LGTVRIVIPYAPREVFKAFHERKQRWAAIVAHRRAGKTVACVNDLLRAALSCQKQNGRFAYVAPQHNQAKDIAWGYVKQFAGVVPGVDFNETELRADFPNGARIRLYGADNPDRLRGIYLDGVVLDEYADMRPSVWGEIVRPLLTDRQGWAIFIGTPKGKNAFWEVWDHATQSPDWYALNLKASQTHLIAEDELADAKRQMSEDQYAQEFECSFEAAIQGAYFGVEMRRAEEEGRICAVPHDPAVEVFTAWDLGIGDATAIWFAQTIGREVRVLDYYEASGVGIDHYVKVLRDKPYLYGRHFLPHDADASELGTGKSIRESLAGLGVRDTAIAPKLTVEEGINAARMLIPKCVFDAKKCKEGLEALRQYRKEYDEKLKTFKQRPLHDWASHGADAFRYLALSVDRMTPQKKLAPIQYRPSGIV